MRVTQTEAPRLMRRYMFKLYPTAAQDEALWRQSRMGAELWNALLQVSEQHWRAECERVPKWRCRLEGAKRKRLSKYDYSRMISHELRPQCPEWREVSIMIARGVAHRLDLAFKAFVRNLKEGKPFHEAGYPAYKRTINGTTLSLGERAGTAWRFKRVGAEISARGSGGWRVCLKGIPGEIKARGQIPVRVVAFSTGEIMHRAGAWWLSIAVETDEPRRHGTEQIQVNLDLIDRFARVERADGGAPAASKEENSPRPQHLTSGSGQDPADSGAVETKLGYTVESLGQDPADSGAADTHLLPPSQGLVIVETERELARAAALCERASAIDSERERRFQRGSCRWRRYRRIAGRLQNKAQRIRQYAQHRLAYEIVDVAASIAVTMPEVKEQTRSPRGSRKNPGANVKAVSELNRHALNQSPAAFARMLEYKARHAGIEISITRTKESPLAAGAALVEGGRKIRRIGRQIRKEANV